MLLLHSVPKSRATIHLSQLAFRHAYKTNESQNPKFRIATSIQHAIRDGNVHTGYNIFTTFHAETSATVEDKTGSSRSPGRLLAHILLHSLLRNNRAHAAASFAKLCMERGIRIRKSTFFKVFAAISPPSDLQLSPLRTEARLPQTRPPSLTAAISLLAAARRSNHKQEPWMYDRVLSALLLQGEMLTAALLFATIVREWNARQQLKKTVKTDNGPHNLDEQPDGAPGAQASDCVPQPTNAWMRQIIKSLTNSHQDTVSKFDQHQAMRGLSVLASLLWDHVPFVPSRSHLIKAVAETPRESHTNAKIHEEWHSRLENLCTHPTSLAPLDSASYHSLLHYSFRQRGSLDLAARVLELLCMYHRPTSATYNILIREATKMNEDNLSLQLRERLSSRPTNYIARSHRVVCDSNTAALAKIMEILIAFPAPTVDEYTLIAVMLADLSAGDISNASRILFLQFPLLNQPSKGVKRDLGSTSATRRARLLSPHFWATAALIASEAYSMTLSMRIWRFVKRAEKASSANGAGVVRLYGTEAYTNHLRLFHRRLSEIDRRVCRVLQQSPGDGSSGTRIARLFTLYEWVLRNLHAVLASLRDSAIDGLTLDKGLSETLLSLADLTVRLENLLPRLAHPIISPMQRSQYFHNPEWQYRVRRILGILRRILSSQHGLLPKSGSGDIVYPGWWHPDQVPTRVSTSQLS